MYGVVYGVEGADKVDQAGEASPVEASRLQNSCLLVSHRCPFSDKSILMSTVYPNCVLELRRSHCFSRLPWVEPKESRPVQDTAEHLSDLKPLGFHYLSIIIPHRQKETLGWLVWGALDDKGCWLKSAFWQR